MKAKLIHYENKIALLSVETNRLKSYQSFAILEHVPLLKTGSMIQYPTTLDQHISLPSQYSHRAVEQIDINQIDCLSQIDCNQIDCKNQIVLNLRG